MPWGHAPPLLPMIYTEAVASRLELPSIPAGSSYWLGGASRLKSYLEHTLLMEVCLRYQVQG